MDDLTQYRAILASELANRRAEALNPRRAPWERTLLASMAEDSAEKLAAVEREMEMERRAA